MIASALAIDAGFDAPTSARLTELTHPPRIRRSLRVPPPKRPPSVVKHIHAQERELSFNPAEKFFNRDEHRRRLAAALRKRLHPNTGLHAKVLADAIDVTPETISNWCRAYSDPSSHKIGELMAYFRDVMFWVEIYGPIGNQMKERFAEREAERAKEAEQERRHLALLTGTQE